jgi:hypothetical protein
MRSSVLIATAITLFSCTKQTNNCQNIQNARASSNGPVTIGDSLRIYTQEVGGYRVYSWTGPNYFTSQEPFNVIPYAELKNEGWYYVSISNSDCNTKVDSVFVDVKLKQGTPSCNIAANTSSFNNLPNNSYSSIQKLYDPTYSFLSLRASGTVSMYVFFHDYWKTHEPEDGIYETTNIPSFSGEPNYNKVFINTTISSIYFSSHEYQTVYVSHVSGKLQVRFCNLTMSGTNGASSFTTIASSNLIQQ